MDFLKGLDLGSIEKVVNALDEFPERTPTTRVPDVTASGAAKHRQALQAWSELGFEGRKHEWEVLCNKLRKLPSKAPSSGPADAAQHWQERAQSAEQHLAQLCNKLLALPDPTPILESAAALSAKILEVEASNRQLRAVADAAAADSREVQQLVEAHRQLEAQHKKLQEKLTAREAELSTASAAAADTQALQDQLATQTAEVKRLQGVLRSLREEHESTQAALWEATSRQEQADGTRHRELEVAQEEVEALTARCTELSLRCGELGAERDRLQQRLAAALAKAGTSGSGGLASGRMASTTQRGPRVTDESGGRASGDGAQELRTLAEGLETGKDDGWSLAIPEQDAAASAVRTEQAEAGGAAGGWGSPPTSPFQAAAAIAPSLSGRLSSGVLGSAASGDEFWERQLRMRGEQVAQLQAQLERMAGEVAEAAARHETQVRGLSNQLAAAQLAVTRLQGQLDARPTAEAHAELRMRAAALQQLVDVQIESEAWSQEAVRQPLASLGGPNTPAATQSLLQERNRALAAELAQAKRTAGERGTELAATQQQLGAMQKEAAQQLALIKRLEADLAAVRAPDMHAGLNRQATEPTTHLAPSQPHTTQHALLPALSATAGSPAPGGAPVDGATGAQVSPGPGEGVLLEPSTPPASDSSGKPGSSGGNLLEILALQRDRFRQRASQLEEEKGVLSEELASTKRQLEAVRADNVALYEKVRYLEQYSQKALAQAGPGKAARPTVIKVDRDGVVLAADPLADGAKAHRYQCGPLSLEFGGGARGRHPTASQGAGVRARPRGSRLGAGLCFPEDPQDEEAGSGGPEARYTKAYEARVNPFAEFQQGEMDSRVRSLQLHERAVLAGSKLVVGSRWGRAFLAIYTLLLHIFIMVLVYYAMMPRTRIEYVDANRLAQQQAAAAAAAAERHGRALLSSWLHRLWQ